MTKFEIGDRVNWKGQPERLIYMGCNWSGNGFWHQFSLVGNPDVVWCETPEHEGLDSFEYSDATVGGWPVNNKFILKALREFNEVDEPISFDYHYEIPKKKAQWKQENNRHRVYWK